MNPDPEQAESVTYRFDGFRVDPTKRLVYGKNGEAIPLKAKAFDTLLYLVEHAGRVVERDELLTSLWPDTIVEENNLTQHISALRRSFGERPDEHRYIATIPGRGYKFVADVFMDEPKAPGLAEPDKAGIPARPVLAILGVVVLALLASAYFLWTDPQTDETPRSIAVLPFKPLVVTRRDESLEMGMADTIIAKLAKTEGIIVRPLTAVRRFSSIDSDAIEAGRALGVEAVLDGSVQLADDRVRVSAKLLRVSDSKQLWSGQFDEELTDIFVVQDSISERVGAALEVRLAQNARRHYTDNAEAYQLYARGRYHSFKLTPEETTRGLGYFQQAIVNDPSYALAYAGMSDAYRSLALSSEYPPAETLEKSLEAAKQAIALDNKLPEGHITYGMMAFWYLRDWSTAEAEFKTALELDSNSAFGHLYYAHLLSNIGRHEEAIAEAYKARIIDPVSPFVSSLEGQFLLHAGRFDEAFAQLQKASEIDPNLWMPQLYIARTNLELGRFSEAEAAAQKATQLSPAQSISIAYEAYAAARLGKEEKARSLLDQLSQRSRERYVPPYHLAIVYLGLKDKESALSQLERGVAERDPKVVFLKVERTWDEIRSEPRFVELIRKMNLE